MNRRQLGRLAFGATAGIALAPHVWSQAAFANRDVDFFSLGAGLDAHEMAWVANNLLVVSLPTNSQLAKVRLDILTGRPVEYQMFTQGTSTSALHGLWTASGSPGRVWCTLEADNKVQLLDTFPGNLSQAPAVLQEIALPSLKGPHNIIQIGNELWVTNKQHASVVRIATSGTLIKKYNTDGLPIYVAKHPGSGDFYVSLDQNSKIMRIDGNDNVTVTPIPPAMGTTPVGLIAGPGASDGVWFVLASNNGRFARITSNGQIHWHQLTGAASNYALLHLAFENPLLFDTRVLWLLATSLLDPAQPDALVRVELSANYQSVLSQEIVPLESGAKAHRVLPTFGLLFRTVLATELALTRIAVVDNGLLP